MIYIIGPTGSGKTTLLNEFSKFPYLCLDTGKFWREYFQIESEVSFHLEKEKSKFPNPYWEYETILSKWQNTTENFTDFVISGYRSIKNINESLRVAYLMSNSIKQFPFSQVKIIFVDSNSEIKLKRYMIRENLSYEDAIILYQNDFSNDVRWGVYNAKKYATHFFYNEGKMVEASNFVQSIVKETILTQKNPLTMG